MIILSIIYLLAQPERKESMTKSNINLKKGFTIIEVVLVLAIAGLIFIMVFVALPNLQRSQRDTQRRDDYSQLAANISNYMTSNGGQLPKPGATLDTSKYINENGLDPYGQPYNLTIAKCKSGTGNNVICGEDTDSPSISKLNSVEGTASSHVYVIENATCNMIEDASVPIYNSSSRLYVVYGQLESGTYCQEG